jgi:hypothetical protein
MVETEPYRILVEGKNGKQTDKGWSATLFLKRT